MNLPPEHEIERVMVETGMDRLQAIHHLQAKTFLIQKANEFNLIRFLSEPAPPPGFATPAEPKNF